MTKEQAVEIVLNGDGRTLCGDCHGHGGSTTTYEDGSVWTCDRCHGQGYFIKDSYAAALEMLGLTVPNGVLESIAMRYYHDP